MVIDDNHDAADVMGMLVRHLGAETRVAYDGMSGLAALEEFGAQIVLLDIGMPGMDGYEVARRLRTEHAKDTTMTLIALTGYGQASDRAGAQEAGFDDFLVKPVDLDVLRTALAKILQKSPME